MIPVCSPGIMVKKNNYLVPGFELTVCNVMCDLHIILAEIGKSEHNFFKRRAKILFCNSDLKRTMQFKLDWNKTIYKNICANTTILMSKMPWLHRQNIISISS